MAAVDQWAAASGDISGPIRSIVAVTPSDDDDLANVTRGLYVGVSGNVSVVTAAGETVTLTGLAAGVWHPLRVSRVRNSSTTATSILAGY